MLSPRMLYAFLCIRQNFQTYMKLLQLHIFFRGFTLAAIVATAFVPGSAVFRRGPVVRGGQSVGATRIYIDLRAFSRAEIEARPYPTAKTDEGKKDRK